MEGDGRKWEVRIYLKINVADYFFKKVKAVDFV